MSLRFPVKRPRGIQLKLALAVTLAAGLAFLIAYVLMLGGLLGAFQDQDRSDLDARILSYWAAWQLGGNQGVLDRAAADLRLHGSRPFLMVLKDPNGEDLARVVPGGWDDFDLDDPDLDVLTLGQYEVLKHQSVPYSLRLTGALMADGSRVIVGVSTENREFLLTTFRRITPWALLVLVLSGVAIGAYSTRRFGVPLNRLNEEIDGIIATGELDRRLSRPGTGDQIDGLIGRFNVLLDRVESLFDGMKDTLDAVAHDLRTPLTRLRGGAELALGHPQDTERLREALADAVEQTDQVGTLLSALMDIAEAEKGVLDLEKTPCDLAGLAAEVGEMYSFVAEEKNLRLDMRLPTELPVLADQVKIRRIIGNLLDNAVKYGRDSGLVQLEVWKTDSHAFVRVSDDGPGISPEDQSRVFDRLFRGDRSRGSRGLGLGLSLVKAFVDAHDGNITVSGREGQGTVFLVELPILSKT